MLVHIISLIESFFSSGLFEWFLVPVLCLAVLATVPCILRELVRVR